MYTNEIGYCMTHNNLVPTDSPPKSCTVIYDPESVNLKYQILYGKEWDKKWINYEEKIPLLAYPLSNQLYAICGYAYQPAVDW